MKNLVSGDETKRGRPGNQGRRESRGSPGKSFHACKVCKNFQLINYVCRCGQSINGVGPTCLHTLKSLSTLTVKALLIILPKCLLIESRQCER